MKRKEELRNNTCDELTNNTREELTNCKLEELMKDKQKLKTSILMLCRKLVLSTKLK